MLETGRAIKNWQEGQKMEGWDEGPIFPKISNQFSLLRQYYFYYIYYNYYNYYN